MSEDFKELLRTRKFWIIAVTVVLILSIAAYFFFQRPEPTVVDNTPVELTFWSLYPNAGYADTINKFQSLPGNAQVKVQFVPVAYGDGQDYYKKLVTDLARGVGPDVFMLRNDDLPAYKEFMTPMKNIPGFSDSKLLADYKTNFVNLAVKDTVVTDQIYGITNHIQNLQLYYNQNLLEQAGIASPPQTWKDLDGQLGLLNKRNSTRLNFTQSGISLGTGTNKNNGDLVKDTNINRFQDILPALLFQNGGQLFDSQTKAVVFGSDKNQKDVSTNNATTTNFNNQPLDENLPALQALKFYLSFSDTSSNRYSWNEDSDNNVDAFLQGKLAYIIHYSYLQDEINQRNSRLRYGVSELPQLDLANKKTYGSFFMTGLNRAMERDVEKNPKSFASIKKLQKSREFLYYLTTPDAQLKFATQTNLPSARRDILSQQISGDEKLRIFARGALYADSYYKPSVSGSEKIWADLIYRIRFNNESPSNSLRKAITEYSLLVSKGPDLRL